MSGESKTRNAIKARRAEVAYWKRKTATVESAGNDETPDITSDIARDMDDRWDR